MAIIISDHASQNILSLSEPDIFGGRLEAFTISHEQLTLRFSNLEESLETFQLILVMVKYIDLPYGWQGGRVDTASEEECWKLLAQVYNFNEKQANFNEIKWDFLDCMRLYVFMTPKSRYRVLAAHGIQTEPTQR